MLVPSLWTRTINDFFRGRNEKLAFQKLGDSVFSKDCIVAATVAHGSFATFNITEGQFGYYKFLMKIFMRQFGKTIK